MLFDRVAKWAVRIDGVMVPSAVAGARDDAPAFQIGNDLLYCPFGDADALGYVAQPHRRVFGKAEQDVGVIAQKRPPTH